MWEFWDKMTFGCLVLWPSTEYTIKGKVVASPSLGHGESCEFMFACGLSMHQSVATTH
jgi:hypothetical protein